MSLIITTINVKKALHKSKIYGVDYCLNPYRGCQHGCRYCYAELIIRKAGKIDKWGSYLDIKNNFPELLEKEILKAKRGLIMISAVTDPYQPMEAKTNLTRKCLEILLNKGFGIYILTKSPLVLRDMNTLKKFEDCEVGITITTDNEHIKRLFEPSAPSIESRVDALKKLKNAGIKTSAFIGPALPMNPQRLFRMIENSADLIYLDKLNYSFKVSSIYKNAGLSKFMGDEYFKKILDFFNSHHERVINCMD